LGLWYHIAGRGVLVVLFEEKEMEKKWQIFAVLKKKSLPARRQEIINHILRRRGIEDRRAFFDPPSPLKIDLAAAGISRKEAEKAKKRIYLAKERKEKILIYGDYDADGITATAILWETLWGQGFDVFPYIPQREEGYGLKKEVVAKIKKKYPRLGLVITVDNGITAHKEIEGLKNQGIDVIVADHHVKEKTFPPAVAIVWSKKICGAAVSWFLAREFSSSAGEKLSLAAIGTVADLMPLLGVNRALVKYGLRSLRRTRRVGILSLLQEAGLEKENLGSFHLGFVLGPRLNAMGRLAEAMDSLRLLCTTDGGRAQLLARRLGKVNRQRQDMAQKMFLQAQQEIIKTGQDKDNLLLVAADNFHPGLVGLVAGKLTEEFYRPAVVIAKGEDGLSKASARSIEEFNIIRALRKQEKKLLAVGGHSRAAGFTLKTAQISSLQKELKKEADRQLKDKKLAARLTIDAAVRFSDLNLSLYEEIEKLAPFGLGNSCPIFATTGVIIEAIRRVGRDKNHLKLILDDPLTRKIEETPALFSSAHQEAIGFGQGERVLKVGEKIDVAYSLLVNEWGGRRKLELKIEDIKKNEK